MEGYNGSIEGIKFAVFLFYCLETYTSAVVKPIHRCCRRRRHVLRGLCQLLQSPREMPEKKRKTSDHSLSVNGDLQFLWG